MAKTNKIILAVRDKEDNLLGYKLDTFWSIGNKQDAKEHSEGDEQRLIGNFLSSLNSKNYTHSLNNNHEELSIIALSVKTGYELSKTYIAKDKDGVWKSYGFYNSNEQKERRRLLEDIYANSKEIDIYKYAVNFGYAKLEDFELEDLKKVASVAKQNKDLKYILVLENTNENMCVMTLEDQEWTPETIKELKKIGITFDANGVVAILKDKKLCYFGIEDDGYLHFRKKDGLCVGQFWLPSIKNVIDMYLLENKDE